MKPVHEPECDADRERPCRCQLREVLDSPLGKSLDIELLARSMPSCIPESTWGSDMHFDPIYSFGSIHQLRCIQTAKKVAAVYERLARLAAQDRSPEPSE